LTDLDDAEALRAADPGAMLEAVVSLAAHCREGYRLGREAPDLPVVDGVTAIACCGMGGSAIGGDVLAALAAPRLRMPVAVIRSSQLPEWVGPHTLVVATSYSGDTDETLALFEGAVGRGSRMVAVTSGGQLARRAADLELGRVIVPGGAMPRAAFGYLALATLGALEAMGVVPRLAADVEEAALELDGVLDRAGPHVPTADNTAKRLALEIGERVPVVWGAEGIGAVAAGRWRTQFNENAKRPAFSAVLPELDHNEVVGWSEGQGEGFAVVALRHAGEPADVAARFGLSMEIAAGSGALTREVWAQGRSPLARLLTLVQEGDLVATYAALAQGVDPTPIDAIVQLKRTLAEA
jgi:glucose/mannose-6-phosphate isomerase